MKKLLKKEHCVNGVACCIILLLLTLALLLIHMEYVDVHGTDNTISSWAREDVLKAQEAGIVLKKGDFQEPITREEFADIALRFVLYQSEMQQPAMSGIYDYYIRKHIEGGLKSFPDTRKDSAANIAYTLGMVRGGDDGTYRPEDLITRQEAAVLLANVYEFCSGQSEEPEEESRKKAFLTEKYSDGKDIGTWASAGAEMMTRWDVMHGMEDGSFRPQGIYTREQCCVSFLRLSEKTPVCLEKGNVPPLLTEEEYAEYLKESDLSRMSDCAVGLLPDGNQGSRVVIYDTDTWNYQDLMDLPDVTPDNYAAVTSDGKYIAYTDWSEAYTRRYLRIYNTETGKTKDYFTDLPSRNEIIKISWMPDDETLLYIHNDQRYGTYQEIGSLNVKDGREKTLIKGGTWRVKTLPEDVLKEGFYLKDEGRYQEVQEIRTEDFVNNVTGEITEQQWAYYLLQKDVDRIYQRYGGEGSFDISLVPNMMSVEFAPPRCSADGKKMIYSASLKRNSAPGTHTPLWMISSIWEYDFETEETEIIYTQKDGGCIGRTDWMNDDSGLTFVSWYEFQGSRDNINYLDRKNGRVSVIFPYTEEHYNNVTLLPADAHRVTFTSSSHYEQLSDSETYQYDLKSGKVQQVDLKYAGEKAILEKFVYVKMKGDRKDSVR